MRIIYMGTPDIAARILCDLTASEHEIVLAVTQPDKPVGRKQEMTPSAVKKEAVRLGIPVYQPERIRNEEAIRELEKYEADIIVVAAFGQIIPKEILEMKRFGCVNVHASILPMYRGAAPIQWAVIDGLKETGVTIMQMDEGLDTGDIIAVKTIPVADDETGGSLFDKIAVMSGPFLLDVLKSIEEGTAVRTPQTGESCYASMLSKKTGLIDWSKSADQIDHLIRGVTPWPGAHTLFGAKKLKVLKASVVKLDMNAEAGTVCKVTRNEMIVACGAGFIRLDRVQLEGKKAMEVCDFLRGTKIEEGTKLG